VPEAIVRRGDPTVLMFAAQIAAAPPPPAPPPEDDPPKAKHGKGAKKAVEKPVHPEAPEELRLMTIERAVGAGVVDADVLRGAYSALPVSTDESTSADRIAVGSARERAATYQLALAQSVAASRAEVIGRVFDLMRTDGASDGSDIITAALVYAPNVGAMAPTVDVAWFGGTAIRILARAATATPGGSAATAAHPWLDLMDTVAPTDKAVATARANVWPYVRLMAPAASALGRDEAAAWIATLPAAPPLRAVTERADALDLLAAVDEGVNAGDWQSLLVALPQPSVQTTPVPATSLWDMLTLAAHEGRVGETVALTLRLMGADAGPPAPLAVSTGLAGLTAVARGGDARAIAIETAFVRGL
jgi:hypothetical protein